MPFLRRGRGLTDGAVVGVLGEADGTDREEHGWIYGDMLDPQEDFAVELTRYRKWVGGTISVVMAMVVEWIAPRLQLAFLAQTPPPCCVPPACVWLARTREIGRYGEFGGGTT